MIRTFMFYVIFYYMVFHAIQLVKSGRQFVLSILYYMIDTTNLTCFLYQIFLTGESDENLKNEENLVNEEILSMIVSFTYDNLFLSTHRCLSFS